MDLLKDSAGVFVRIACGTGQALERIRSKREILERSLHSSGIPLQGLNLVQGAVPAAVALLQMATGEERGVFSARA